jgi:hypothetical protein
MSDLWELERVLALLDGDREIVDELAARGICAPRSEGFTLTEVETARVARVLIRELEVNWPGAEIILRLRGELLATHRQVADLLELLRSARGKAGQSRSR